jgi:flagellar biosynthesis/type III secretory pathway protein FliH
LIELRKDIELERYANKRMAVLWLRFLKEIGVHRQQQVSEDLLADEHIRKALEICEEGGFTDEELLVYDRYWDSVRIEKAFINDSLKKGKAEGLAEGKAEGLAEGKAEGLAEGKAKGLAEGKAEREELEKELKRERKKRMEEKKEIVLKSIHSGIPIATISHITGLPDDEIQWIVNGGE